MTWRPISLVCGCPPLNHKRHFHAQETTCSIQSGITTSTTYWTELLQQYQYIELNYCWTIKVMLVRTCVFVLRISEWRKNTGTTGVSLVWHYTATFFAKTDKIIFSPVLRGGALEPWKVCNGALEHGNFAFGSLEPIKIYPGDSQPEIPWEASQMILLNFGVIQDWTVVNIW